MEKEVAWGRVMAKCGEWLVAQATSLAVEGALVSPRILVPHETWEPDGSAHRWKGRILSHI